MVYEFNRSFAQQMDENDPLKEFRNQFYIPSINGKPATYFCGNSLGLQPKNVKEHIDIELEDWAKMGVEGHFHGRNPWFYYHHFLEDQYSKIVGSKKGEVVVMNSLTVNLHLLLISFYQPTKTRYKIIIEAGAFPSDQYAVDSQAQLRGFDAEDAIIELHPRAGEESLRTEDILATINETGDALALVMMGGVNYYTGQFFQMEIIAEAAHQIGAIAGFDLAHAAGNIPLKLHDWNIDFACWCTYKYMNSGPGGTSGIFVHEKHGNNTSLHRLAGWWGNDEKKRFQMPRRFEAQQGAAGWQMSNAQIFPMAIHKASLALFEGAGIDRMRAKSETLTGYLFYLVEEINRAKGATVIQNITPTNFAERGCQVSLIVEENGKKIFDALTEQGFITDWREPSVIRLAPVPLYNSYEEVYSFAAALQACID